MLKIYDTMSLVMARIYPHRGRKGPHLCLQGQRLQLYPRRERPLNGGFDTIRRYFEYHWLRSCLHSTLQMWTIRSNRAKEEGITPQEVADKYIAAFP